MEISFTDIDPYQPREDFGAVTDRQIQAAEDEVVLAMKHALVRAELAVGWIELVRRGHFPGVGCERPKRKGQLIVHLVAGRADIWHHVTEKRVADASASRLPNARCQGRAAPWPRVRWTPKLDNRPASPETDFALRHAGCYGFAQRSLSVPRRHFCLSAYRDSFLLFACGALPQWYFRPCCKGIQTGSVEWSCPCVHVSCGIDLPSCGPTHVSSTGEAIGWTPQFTVRHGCSMRNGRSGIKPRR